MFKQSILALIFCLSTFSSSVVALTQAHVYAGEVGQGFLLKRLETCYLVSPQHVIGDALFAEIITNTPAKSVGEAQLLETFGYDLALLTIDGSASNSCDTDISSFKPIDHLLGNTTSLSLKYVNQDGSQSYTTVDLSDASIQYLRVRPRSTNPPLYKGLSGSTLYSSDVPVGILQSIDANTNEGIVLRMDRVISTIAPFFSVNATSNKLVQSKKKGAVLSSAEDLSLSPLNWSTTPIDRNHRLVNLLDSNPDTQWSAVFDGAMITLEFMIGKGDKNYRFRSLELETNTTDVSSKPRDFEVLVSRKKEGRRGWTSIYAGTYLKNEDKKILNFAPVKAKRIRIRFASNWGGSSLRLSNLKLDE